MAPPRKPAEARQRRNKAPELPEAPRSEIVAQPGTSGSAGVALPPAPDERWQAVTLDQWRDLWESDLASRIRRTDHPAIHRLFDWRDRQRRCWERAATLREQADAEPLTAGSKGQPVANPLYAAADSAEGDALAIEARIVALEDRLGLTPKARLGLGLAEVKGANLAGANALLAEKLKEVAGAPDPRAVAGDAPATPG